MLKLFFYINNHKKMAKQSGFSLLEIIIAVTIVAILLLLAISTMGRQLSKSRDGRRKADLARIKTAFEDYNGDRGAYPPITALDDCDGTSLAPYLNIIPCDPLDNTPYIYRPYPDSTDRTGGFRVYSKLELTEDPIVTTLGCNTGVGCGLPVDDVTDAAEYTYGVSEGVPVYFSGGAGGFVPTTGICCPVGGGVCNSTTLIAGACPTHGGPYIDETECVNNTPCEF